MATSEKMVRQHSPSSSAGSSPEQNNLRSAVHEQQQSLHILVEPQPDGHTNMIHLINPSTGQILSSFIAEHGAHIEIQPGFVFRVPFPQEHGYPSYPPQQFPPQTHYQHGMMPQTMNQMNIMAPPFNPRCPIHGSPNHHNSSSLGFQSQNSSGDDRLDRRREKLQRRLREKHSGGGGKNGQCNCMRHNGNYHAYQHGYSQVSSQITKGMKHHPSSKINGPKMDESGAKVSGEHDVNEEDREENEEIAILASPKATVVDAYTVTVSWADCIANNNHLSSCQFELEMSSKSSGFNTIHVGTEAEYTVTSLNPASEYSFRICALLHGKKGTHSDAVTVETPATVPGTPQQPRVTQKTKTSLLLKWSAPNDGGSPITMYRLHWNEGKQNGEFAELYSGLQRQYKLSHKLPPGVLCQFKLQAVNCLGSSKFSQVLKCLTSAGPPDAPEPPKLTESGTTMIALMWNEPANNGAPIMEYKLEMEDEKSGYGFMVVYCGEQRHYTCKNLLRNTLYKFRLLASNSQGSSKFSTVIAFATLPEPPGKMEKPKIQGKVKTNSFTVCWDAPKDTGGAAVVSYCLEMDDGQGGSYKEVCKGPNTEYAADGLKPGHTYRLRVTSQGAGGRGPWSPVAHISTLPVCPGAASIPRLSPKIRPEPTSLHLEWDPLSYDGGAPISLYLLRMTKSESTEYQVVYEGPRRSCDICGLEPGTTYWFSLQAQNKAGLSPVSEPVSIDTAPGPPDACQIVDISCKSPTAVRVEWQEPQTHGTPITAYTVEQLDNEIFTKIFEGLTLWCELKKNIHPATAYFFRVQAQSLAGPGPYSDIVSVQTPPAPPAAVSHIKVTDHTSDAALIQWKHPLSNGSQITEYKIEISGVTNFVLTVPVPSYNVEEKVTEPEDEEDHVPCDEEDVDSDFEDESDVESVEYVKEETIVRNPEFMEHEITGLLADTAYRLRIQAVNKVGSSPQSHSLQFVTKELPPSAPTLDLTSASHHSLKLKWGDASTAKRGHIGTSYTLQMKNKNGLFTNVYTGMSQSSSVTKLKELSQYTFRIRARNDAGEGEFSEPKSFYTKAQPPSVVKDLKSKETTSTSALVSWSPVDMIKTDDQVEYLLQMLHQDTSRDFVEIYRGSRTHFQLQSLLPDQEYQLRVCAIRGMSLSTVSLVPHTQSELKGPFSSILRLWTLAESRTDNILEEKTHEKDKELSTGMELSDSQIALVILGSFLIICLLVALGLKLSLTGY